MHSAYTAKSSKPGVLTIFCLVYPLANDVRIIYPHLFGDPRKFTPIFDTCGDVTKKSLQSAK